jgi:hypothetical protein
MSPGSRLIPWLRFARRLFTGGVLAYVVTSLTCGGTWPARHVFEGLAAGWALRLCFAGRMPHRHPHSLRFLEMVATNLAFALVLAEGGLRLCAAYTGRSPLIHHELDAYRLVPGADYGAGLKGNHLGYPGNDFVTAKRPGVLRIAALGDSFAVGPTVPFRDNYLSRLEQEVSGVEVYNFGVSGTGPREYEAVLRHDVWAFQPDLALVSIFVGNDVTEVLATPRHLDPRGHALYLLLERAGRLMREHWREDRSAALAPPGARRLAPGLSPATFREVEARRLAVCRPGTTLEKKWRSALAHLDRIINDCRRRRVPAGFVLIPDEFQVNPGVLADALHDARLARDDIDLTLPQRRFQDFFAERRAPCLDLLPLLQAHPDTYTPHDTHWNAEGNRLAAAAIGQWLRRTFTPFSADSPPPPAP